jgi:hypothetical protein
MMKMRAEQPLAILSIVCSIQEVLVPNGIHSFRSHQLHAGPLRQKLKETEIL